MADLKQTVVESIISNTAANEPKALVRKGELDAELAQRPTSAEMAAAIDADTHDAVTVTDTPSVRFVLTGQNIQANVAAGDGLTIGSNLGVRFGTGTNEVARGDHTHAQLHDAATGSSTDSATTSVTGQQVRVDVRLEPGSALYAAANGIGIYSSYFAASDHTHNDVTLATAGFMTAAMLAELQAATAGLDSLDFIDTSTIRWVIGSNHAAHVRAWTGLKENSEGNGLEVDFTEVARADHTHDNFVIGSANGQSFRIIMGNICLWDDEAYQDNPDKPWRALGVVGGQLFLGEPQGG